MSTVWVNRASKAEKVEMQLSVDSENDLHSRHPVEHENEPFVPVFTLERRAKSYIIAARIKELNVVWFDIVSAQTEIARSELEQEFKDRKVGDLLYTQWFFRCPKCGKISDHYDGGSMFCFYCFHEVY